MNIDWDMVKKSYKSLLENWQEMCAPSSMDCFGRGYISGSIDAEKCLLDEHQTQVDQLKSKLAKVNSERDELARYIVEDLREYVQEVTDDHIQKFGLNYRPERIKYYQDELAKIDKIKAGQS